METYSNQSLRVLESALEEYKLDIPCASHTDQIPYCGVKGEKQWLIDNGALKNCDEFIILDISKFQERQNKLNELRKLQAKTQYAKKMEGQAQLI